MVNARRTYNPLIAVAVSLVASLTGATACSKSKDVSTDTPAASAASAKPAATVAGLSLPGGFEGEVDLTVKGEDPSAAPTPVSLLVKATKARMNVPEQLAKAAAKPFIANAYVILDGDAKKLYAVLDSRHQVVVVDLNRAGEDLKSFPTGPGEHGAAGQRPPTKVTRTGQFDTVAGYRCENWTLTSETREGTMCVADQAFPWFQLPPSAIPTANAWAAELMDGKHMPLRVVGYGKDGVTESGKLEITKLEKKSVADADLQVPPTYAVMDIASMVRGMGAMPGIGGMPGMGGMPRMPPGMPPGAFTMPPRPKAN